MMTKKEESQIRRNRLWSFEIGANISSLISLCLSEEAIEDLKELEMEFVNALCQKQQSAYEDDLETLKEFKLQFEEQYEKEGYASSSLHQSIIDTNHNIEVIEGELDTRYFEYVIQSESDINRYYIVSEWIAEKLKEKGEFTCELGGLSIWGETKNYLLDLLQEISDDLQKARS